MNFKQLRSSLIIGKRSQRPHLYVAAAIILAGAYAGLQLLRVGSIGNEYLFMTIGAFAALVSLAVFMLLYKPTGQPSQGRSLALIWFGFFPWAFGGYLLIFQAVLGIAEIRNAAAPLVIAKVIVAFALGYTVTKGMSVLVDNRRRAAR